MNFNKDVFVEHMIKKQRGPKDVFIFFGSAIGAVLIMYICMLIWANTGYWSVPFYAFFIVIFGVWYVNSTMVVEYEYSNTNGDLTVDKIINKQKRKRVVSFECKEIEAYGDYDEFVKKQAPRNYDKKFMACTYDNGRGAKYALVNAQRYGRCLLVFNPTERMEDAIIQFMPRHLKFEFMRKK